MSSLRRIATALRAFLQGFVGPVALPTDPAAAKAELKHRCEGRGRCC